MLFPTFGPGIEQRQLPSCEDVLPSNMVLLPAVAVNAGSDHIVEVVVFRDVPGPSRPRDDVVGVQ